MCETLLQWLDPQQQAVIAEAPIIESPPAAVRAWGFVGLISMLTELLFLVPVLVFLKTLDDTADWSKFVFGETLFLALPFFAYLRGGFLINELLVL